MRVYRCKQPFVKYIDGVPHRVSAGTLVREDDPRRQGQEKQFEAVDDFMDRTAPVEQATAGPGEKRSVAAETKQDKTARRRQGKATKQDSAPAPSPESAANDAVATSEDGAS